MCLQRREHEGLPHTRGYPGDTSASRGAHGREALGRPGRLPAQPLPQRRGQGPQARVLHAVRRRQAHVPRRRARPHGALHLLQHAPTHLRPEAARQAAEPAGQCRRDRHAGLVPRAADAAAPHAPVEEGEEDAAPLWLQVSCGCAITPSTVSAFLFRFSSSLGGERDRK